MKSSNILLFLSLALAVGCGGGGGSAPAGSTPAQTPVAITVTPVNPAIAAGTQQQFTATGTYSDSSTQDLTAAATWSSSATAVATIGDTAGTKGLATAVAAGTTEIKATFGLVPGSTTLTVTGGGAAANVLRITVNGDLCSGSSVYPNKPCVSVTICAPGTSSCQTINDILLDTGSYGLRIFKQAVTVLPAATGNLAECIQFGDGSSVWGPVQTADVILGGEPAVRVPIQVIDRTFGTATLPSVCSNAHADPAAARYTGILGVGALTYDCGAACASSVNNFVYFSCNGTNCLGTAAPLAVQVKNPAALLPQDNNGVIVRLPGVPAGGAPSVEGSLVLGIGSNVPASITAYSVNQTNRFSTLFDGRTYVSFLDTGSNGYFFTPPNAALLPTCPGAPSWFCPATATDLSATNTASSGFPSGVVPFTIDNFTLVTGNTANNVFAEIGGPFPQSFDWGLPFFLGKDVYVGFEGKTSPTLGAGPFVAY